MILNCKNWIFFESKEGMNSKEENSKWFYSKEISDFEQFLCDPHNNFTEEENVLCASRKMVVIKTGSDYVYPTQKGSLEWLSKYRFCCVWNFNQMLSNKQIFFSSKTYILMEKFCVIYCTEFWLLEKCCSLKQQGGFIFVCFISLTCVPVFCSRVSAKEIHREDFAGNVFRSGPKTKWKLFKIQRLKSWPTHLPSGPWDLPRLGSAFMVITPSSWFCDPNYYSSILLQTRK